MTRLRDRATGLAAIAGLVLILVGLPLVLTHLGATPSALGTPDLAGLRQALLSPDDGRLAMNVIAVVAWITWAVMTLCLLTEVLAQVRGIRPPALPGLRVPQDAAHGLVAAAALLFIATSATTPHTGTATIGPGADLGRPVSMSAVPAVSQTAEGSRTATDDVEDVDADRAHRDGRADASSQPRAAETEHPIHTVRAGESLWSIAQQHLGDGRRFADIVALNPDVIQNPDFLEPGWTLRLPAGAAQAPNAADHDQYVVRPGDTLSQLAQDRLGDAGLYPEIYAASTGIQQRDGQQLTDPDLIEVGWRLDIPSPRPPAATDRPPASRDAAGSKPAGDTAPRRERLRAQVVGPSSAKGPHATGPTRPASPSLRPIEPRPGDSRSPAHEAVADSSDDSPGWLLTGLTGGGVVLAAALLLVLRGRRRAQLRARRPGRIPSVPAGAVVQIEMAVADQGSTAVSTLQQLDDCLRNLALTMAEEETSMPRLAACQLSPGRIVIHLAEPSQLPSPWEGDQEARRWSTTPSAMTGADEDAEAPYPLLVTVGSDDEGDVWLLNCEEAGTMTITGEADYRHDFARYVAAELGTTPWGAHARIDCVGIAAETVGINPARIRHHAQPHAGAELTHVAQNVRAHVGETRHRSHSSACTVATGRSQHPDEDVWPARLLMLDATVFETGPVDEVDELVDFIAVDRGSAGASLIVFDQPTAQDAGLSIELTTAGRLLIPSVGLDLVAVGLTRDEALGCAALIAQSDDDQDVVPADAAGPADLRTDSDQWRLYATTNGGLREEHTLPRAADDRVVAAFATPSTVAKGEPDLEVSSTGLSQPDGVYVEQAAVTSSDLQSLAPRVASHVRSKVAQVDPSLDEDLQAWKAADPSRPRLKTLGPVQAWANGEQGPVGRRRNYYIGLLTYLAELSTAGVTIEAAADVMRLSAGRLRSDMAIVRSWLGDNPTTGAPFLPHAKRAPAHHERGANVYQVDTGPTGLLWDVDLFRRLRLRGQTRGVAGIEEDYTDALALVAGVPFDHLRDSGWLWLLDHRRIDVETVSAIADIALTASSHHIERENLVAARTATETGILAAPYDESLRLQLVAIAHAQGRPDEANRILQEDILLRSDDGGAPTDLSQRTAQVIRNHNWTATGS